MTTLTEHPAARAAPAVWLIAMLLVAGALLLPIIAGAPRGVDDVGNAPNVVLVAVANTSLGAIIVRRRPTHPIGWLLLVGSGLFSAMHLLAWTYASLGPDRAGGVERSAWVALLLQTTTVMSVVVVFHLFPTGRPLSPRWRMLVWACVLGLVCNVVVDGLTPGPMDIVPAYDNPLGATGVGPVLGVVGAAAGVLVSAGIAGGVVSLGLRLRRADGVERQQVKLLFYAAAVGVGALVGANLVLPDLMEHSVVGNLVWGVATASLSLAVTIALLRYRLFDIDRLISRTATYALVTAILAVIYVAVAILPAAMYGLDSDLLVAAATLASAGVFVPVRRRVQAQMDQRFDRARYDATRIAATLGISLRHAVDPDRVINDLVGVVEAALRPSGAQVWLRANRQQRSQAARARDGGTSVSPPGP